MYEVLRAVGVVRDETDPALTSRLTLPILQKLVEDGYLKYVDTEFEWKAVSGRPKYLFEFSSNDIEGLKNLRNLD